MTNQVDESKLYQCTVEVGPAVRLLVGGCPVVGPAMHTTPDPISGAELNGLLSRQAANASRMSGKIQAARKVAVTDVREVA